jgi:hypothetical protein
LISLFLVFKPQALKDLFEIDEEADSDKLQWEGMDDIVKDDDEEREFY